MIMTQDGVRVECMPDGACCKADEEKRSPLDVEEWPIGYEECSGNCFCYEEN